MDILYEYTRTLAHYAHLVLAPAGVLGTLQTLLAAYKYLYNYTPIRL